MIEIKVEKPLRFYEGVIILRPTLTESEARELLQKYRVQVVEAGGDLRYVETWGKRRLANPIKKLQTGLYFHLMFEAGSDCVKELERSLRINEKVLRFYHQKLSSKKSLEDHMLGFKKTLELSAQAMKERDAKFKARREQRRH